MKKSNILYCGMADDVLSPMLLVPEFKTLYAICLLDTAFTKDNTWEGQKEDIKQQLIDGHDDNSLHLRIYREHHTNWPVTKLIERCHILKEEDKNSRWELTFSYLGVERSLVYYHHRNFYVEWPSDIKDINHLMSMGATFMTDKNGTTVKNKKIFKNIVDRCDKKCLYYELYNVYDEEYGFHFHKKDSKIINVRNSDIIINSLKYEIIKHIST